MLTLQQLRGDKDAAVRKLAKKGVDAAPVIAKIEELDDRRKSIQGELDACLAEQNKAAKEIGALMAQGKRDEAEERKHLVADLKARSAELNAQHDSVAAELQSQIVLLPNFPAEIVPEGKTAEDNLVVKIDENYTKLPENPLPHWELARKYDIIDFDLGVKLTGATVHLVNEIPDGGQILLQKAVEILPGDTPQVLQRRVMEQAEWILLPQATELLASQIVLEKEHA